MNLRKITMRVKGNPDAIQYERTETRTESISTDLLNNEYIGIAQKNVSNSDVELWFGNTHVATRFNVSLSVGDRMCFRFDLG